MKSADSPSREDARISFYVVDVNKRWSVKSAGESGHGGHGEICAGNASLTIGRQVRKFKMVRYPPFSKNCVGEGICIELSVRTVVRW